MKLQEVISDKDKKDFLHLPLKIYKSSPNWIRPLDKDIEAVFDKEKNKTFRDGECARWILKNDNDETIGRVAAFYDKKHARKGNDQPTGGMGFFECIDDNDAARMLIDQCKQWLQSKGMEAMDGPINFGSRDRWWGLLIEGFDTEPNYQCNYNPEYYNKFFVDYGFKPYFYQLTFGRKVIMPPDPKTIEKATLTANNPDYRFDYLRKSDWPKLASLIMTVYNKAWANRGEIPELTSLQANQIVKQMKPIMDETLIWFGYYKDEPVAFFLSLPEVNQIFKHVNGKLDLLGKLKFVWHQWRKTNRKAFGVLFGVVPEHQGKGLDGAIIEAWKKVHFPLKRYEDFELNWIGDFNTKMIRVCEQINTIIVKKHVTYRKLFDETKPFTRYPIR